MLYFLTNRNDHFIRDKSITVTNNIREMLDYLSSIPIIGLDIEASRLQPYIANLLLVAVGDKHNQWVIDATSVPVTVLNEVSDRFFIGHNIKYDLTVLAVNGFKMPRKVYDTMIADQRIALGSGSKYALDKVVERRLGIKLPIEKTFREEFFKMDRNSIFTDKHILYSAGDITYLSDIKEKQDVFINLFNMNMLIYEIEMPLIPILAKAELRGMRLHEQKWWDIIHQNKKRKLEIERQLDEELKLLGKGNPYLTGGKFNQERNVQEVAQLDMFGAKPVVKTNKNVGNVNYSSATQIKAIFAHLDEPLPLQMKISKVDGQKVKEEKETVGADALEQYLKKYPETKMKKFIELLIEHADVRTKITSFGENFFDIINPVTKKIHTIYRQCSTDTGRLASGDMKIGFFNSQNVPKTKQYRTCFYGDKDILTIDLTGAELVILSSLAQDDELAKILDDPHSPLATSAYSDVVKYIMENMPATRWKDELFSLLKKKNDDGTVDTTTTNERVIKAISSGGFVVDKKDSKDIRDPFKNIIYGMAYGASVNKIAETLGVSKKYAEIIYAALKRRIPKTIEYLEKASKFGVENGYIIFNKRTNSRRWFAKVIENKKHYPHMKWKKWNLSPSIVGDVERACKNAPIQG